MRVLRAELFFVPFVVEGSGTIFSVYALTTQASSATAKIYNRSQINDKRYTFC